MRNLFNFFPVGQGLFYCGLLNYGHFCFVYDCGTETKNKDLEPYMKEFLFWKKNNDIDFLVISHFHEDHISNIIELSKKFNIKKYFLPYISDTPEINVFILAIYYFRVNKISNKQSVILFKFLADLYRKQYLESFEENELFFTQNDRSYVISNNRDYSFSYQEWVFKFFNKCDPKINKKRDKLLDEIEILRASNDNKNIEEIIEEPDGFSKIKDIYRKVFKKEELNDTSLILLHYPNFLRVHSSNFFYINFTVPEKKMINSFYTLLTGDIPFDKDLANKVIDSFPTGISGIVQVPHHGAKNEWLKFCEFFYKFDIYVVPFGIENHYGHPSPFIKSRVPQNAYYEVTELSGFSYCIDDEIW